MTRPHLTCNHAVVSQIKTGWFAIGHHQTGPLMANTRHVMLGISKYLTNPGAIRVPVFFWQLFRTFGVKACC